MLGWKKHKLESRLPGQIAILKSLLQHHSSKASILRRSAFFIVQLSHPYMTTGKTIALARRTFVGKVMSLLLNMLSRLVITFLPRPHLTPPPRAAPGRLAQGGPLSGGFALVSLYSVT